MMLNEKDGIFEQKDQQNHLTTKQEYVLAYDEVCEKPLSQYLIRIFYR